MGKTWLQMRLEIKTRVRSCMVLDASGKSVNFILGTVESHWKDLNKKWIFMFLKDNSGIGMNERLFHTNKCLIRII